MLNKLLLVVALGCCCAFGLQIDQKEFTDVPRCTMLENDPSLNMTWLMSIDTWSDPIWSKYDLLRVLKISMGDSAFAKFSESALPNSCFYNTGIPSGDKLEVIFNGRRLKGWQPAMSAFVEGVNDWIFRKKYYATNYKVLTDNKSYYVGVNRWADGTFGYYISCPAGQEVSREDQDLIFKKLETYGFTRKSAYYLRQDCPEDFKLAKAAYSRNPQ